MLFIHREEYTHLYEFVNKKQLRIKNKGAKGGGKGGNLDAMMESDDEEHDAYLQKVKAEGRQRYDSDDDDDSDEDSDGMNSLSNPTLHSLLCMNLHLKHQKNLLDESVSL